MITVAVMVVVVVALPATTEIASHAQISYNGKEFNSVRRELGETF